MINPERCRECGSDKVDWLMWVPQNLDAREVCHPDIELAGALSPHRQEDSRLSQQRYGRCRECDNEGWEVTSGIDHPCVEGAASWRDIDDDDRRWQDAVDAAMEGRVR